MAYRLFKTKYKGRDGTRRESPRWHVRLLDHSGTWRRVSGFTDKSVSDRRGRRLEQLATQRAQSKPPTTDQLQWLSELPGPLYNKLAR